VSISIRNYNGEQCCSRVERELKAESNMIIEVSDEGIGMSSDSIANLFQAFFQVERNSIQGSGLGLYICHELVHLMHGHVCCRSELGQGTTFTVVVPLAIPLNRKLVQTINSTQASESESRVNSVMQERRVLVAEDNKVNQMVIASMLKRLNCKFDIVGDGQQAVGAFERGGYFAVLMDLMMPVMDGFEATRRITGSAQYEISRPRVIALTASVTEDEIQAALTSGCHSVISKPVNIERLSEALSDAAHHYRERNRARFMLGTSHRDLSFFTK
jgi:CheY-like chemotaxis protein